MAFSAASSPGVIGTDRLLPPLVWYLCAPAHLLSCLSPVDATRVDGGRVEEVFLAEDSEGCLGWNEQRELSIDQWIAEQGLVDCFAANGGFMELLLQRPREALGDRQVHTAILGLYNLDLFRQTLPSVAPRLALTPAAVEGATHPDEALLALGLRWVAAELGITEICLQRSVRGL